MSGLHLALDRDNNYDESDDRLRSDTLLSALYACALELGLATPGEKTFMERYRISSAFPFWKGEDAGQPVYFLPRPLLPKLEMDFENNETKDRKKKSGIEYFDLPLFEKVVGAGKITLKEENLSKNGRLASEKTIKDLEIFGNASFQHVAIHDWDDKEPVPYYVDKLFFEQGCGLYFLIQCDEKEIGDMKACLRLLADNGIGTDRSSGNGAFDWTDDDWGTLTLNLPDAPASHWMSLSLFVPATKEEMGRLENSAYELTKRGGYISCSSADDYALLTIRKKSVMAFEEGSLLHTAQMPNGQIVDLKPDDKQIKKPEQKNALHPIWRSGRAIFIPINLKQP